MLSHNAYFEQKIQSIGFECKPRRQTVGAIAPGTYHFDTNAPERMTVISGELTVTIAGGADVTPRRYPAGASFEVPAKTRFEFSAELPSAYWCEFL